MKEVNCVNDIISEFDNYTSLYVNKGIFNIIISEYSYAADLSRSEILEELIERFKLINKLYTPRIEKIYSNLITYHDYHYDMVNKTSIAFDEFKEGVKVFKNVKIKSLSKNITDKEVERFNKIISLIPDKFMYKEVLIIKYSTNITFKLHGKYFMTKNIKTIISYLKTFTTLSRFEALIKSYLLTKL